MDSNEASLFFRRSDDNDDLLEAVKDGNEAEVRWLLGLSPQSSSPGHGMLPQRSTPSPTSPGYGMLPQSSGPNFDDLVATDEAASGDASSQPQQREPPAKIADINGMYTF